MLYVNRTGCSWRQLPHDFPPWQTVFAYLPRWNESRVTRPHPRHAAGEAP
ncbi:transposase [Rhodococcus sp. MS16]|nr:transposase [Rhodococcus sp. MS16]